MPFFIRIPCRHLGHYAFDLSKLPVHFITGAAHKFHGPKGVGILYINEQVKVKPNIHGGSQERNMRAGTENVYGIVGFAKALDLATKRLEEDREYINGLRIIYGGGTEESDTGC